MKKWELIWDRTILINIIKCNLKVYFSKSKLQEILVKIKLKPSQLIRKNEADWKALNNRKELNENQILDILIKYPKTIEHPIVTFEDSGVLARPLENLITFLGIN